MFKLIVEEGIVKINTLKKNKDFNYFIAGEIFEPKNYNIEKLYYDLKKNKKLPNLVGEFLCIIEDSDTIYVVNDEVGTIKWYYYYTDNTIMISNNYWEIVNFIEPSVDDINREAIYEQMLLTKTFDGSTFINGIKTILPGNILRYSKKNQVLSVEKYVDIIYEEDTTLTENELFNKVDNLFFKMIDKINQFNNNPKIGITISGGLDSRFPLPFVNKENIASTYLIGQKNGILNPFDYDSAQKMAKMHELNFKMIDPFSIGIKEKILIDILRNPTGDSDIIKSLDYNKNFRTDAFDVLITGAYGGLIGGQSLNTDLLETKDIESFAYKLFYTFSLFKNINQFEVKETIFQKQYRRLIKIINILFDIEIKQQTNSKIEEVKSFISKDFLFNSKYKINTLNKFKEYIMFEKNNNKNNLSIIMKYHLSLHQMNGSFESLQGQVKAYSIYHPYIYNYSKSWPIDFLQDRYIMEKYLFSKHEDLAAIPLQTYDLPIKYRYKQISKFKKFFEKFKILLQFKLKGLSINYTKWFFKDSVQTEINEVFNNENKYFYNIFNKKDVLTVLKYKQYSHFADDLFKMKILIDLIESKGYKHLLEQDKFKQTEKF